MPARPFQLSTRRTAEAVLHAALAALAATPLARAARLAVPAPHPAVLPAVGAVVVALALALSLRLSARGRPLRRWLSNLLLAAPLGLAALACTGAAALAWHGALRGASPGAGTVAALTATAAGLVALLVLLVRQVVPRRCPSCGRPGLIPDGRRAAEGPAPVRGLWPAAWCVRCGDGARRLASGWAPGDPLDRLRRPAGPPRPASPRA
jgi:hypothetical protein